MNSLKKIALIVLAIVYSIIFWNEKLGINLFFYTCALLAILCIENRKSLQSIPLRITFTGTLASGLMVVLLNSFISKFAHLVSFWIMVAFFHHGHLRSLYSSAQYSFTNLFMAQKAMLSDLVATRRPHSKTGIVLYNLKLILIPVFILLIFYALFYNANPEFAKLSDRFWDKFLDLFGNLFDYISFGRILMIIAGLVIAAFVLYKTALFPESDDAHKDIRLQRKRKLRRGRVFDPMNILKQEYRMAVILVLLVNVLLLVVNGIDISWIWINFTVPEGMVLKHFVHEGTYLLIISILLSIAIILYFFRNNLNFYPDNRLLKLLAYAWMAQNMVLSISVFLRNYHYINYHGLAYKRIGVVIFLILTLAGLVTMLIKIAKVRSGYYVVKQNLWAAYLMMITMTLVNWDVIIARFNLNHWNKAGIDVNFYFTLSPKVIPHLKQHLPVIKEQIEACNQAHTNFTPFENISQFQRELNLETLEYIREQQRYTWLSWNLPDYNTVKKLQ